MRNKKRRVTVERRSIKRTGEVVTYNPDSSKGFMKVKFGSSGQRVHFVLNILPDDFKEKVKEASKTISTAKRAKVSREEIKKLRKKVSSMVKGEKFMFELKRNEKGQLVIKRDTIKHVINVKA